MTMTAGARLGPYEIEALIGAGGMGEVYKARDKRLDRTVAIKLLPADLAERADRRARFETEARAISSLNHPHICTLFDVGDEGGRPFIVMEFLDGETLDDRLIRGPLPARDVVRFALQIADALAHAHRAQIVHRDLKPSNVMLTPTGAKLLDFGLARRPVPEPSGGALTTVTVDQRKLTAEGTILGTFQYMAPEQLEGKDADARTDIFAFGTLVYEMATGRKAFTGESQASLIASILTAQPQPISTSRIDAGLPPALDHLVERCLAKSADDRWQTARDVKLELEWIAGGSQSAPVAPATERRRPRLGVTATVALLAVATAVIAAVALLGGRRTPPASAEVTRFTIASASGSVIVGGEQRTRLAISPDGRRVAYVAATGGQLSLWVRSLNALAAERLPGTEGGVSPFWSPDSRQIGFFAPDTGELKKIALAGGQPRTICRAQIEGLPEWGRDGTILYSVFREGIYRVSAEGASPARVTTVDKSQRELNHFWPSFLPDGRHFLYVATANDSATSKAPPSLYVAALDGSPRTALPRIHSRTVYSAPGYLLFVEEGAVLAQPFDLDSLGVTGEAVQIADGVASFRALGTGHFSVSSTGTLIYLGNDDKYRIAWYDRRGEASDPGWPKQTYGSLRLSPDGQQAIVDVYDPRYGEADLWIYDLVRNVPGRFTSEPVSDRNGVWSPDARRILYTTERGSTPNLFTKSFEGSGEIIPMVTHSGPIFAEDWSSDGKWIAYSVNTVQTLRDLWLKPLEGDGRVRRFLDSRFDEFGARFSPDGRWLAFVSNEANSTQQVFVAPVEAPGQRRQVSIEGGTTPRWRHDGKELFYMTPDRRSMMSIEIESLAPLRVGAPRRLFSVGSVPVALDALHGAAYDVTPDGQKFLVSLPEGEPGSAQIGVVLNWPGLLKP
jgi:Tol biopolymer transport system component